MRSSTNQQVCPRTLFKKEEEEKIKKLVKIFGTRHWDLVAQFMEGRTAKQCRDRYSNYLIPGFFQGEWSKEEDQLLIQLYKEHGPKWSTIKKSFHNRSANNIKNRWYYFLHKKVQNYDETKIEKINDEIPKNDNKIIEKYKNTIESKEISDENTAIDNNEILIQQDNEIFENRRLCQALAPIKWQKSMTTSSCGKKSSCRGRFGPKARPFLTF